MLMMAIDIARIMREQHNTFLALASRVAALDESVRIEKDQFQQYLKMYT